MIRAGIFTGGAAIPKSAAIAITAPVRSLGTPRCSRTGDIKAPVVKTAAVEDRIAIEHKIVDIFSANLWSISPVENPVDVPQVGYYYMNNRLGNVPSVPLNSEFSYIFLESYYIKE